MNDVEARDELPKEVFTVVWRENTEWINRNEQAWLIVHDLIEMARDDLRTKVGDAPEELVNAINMALYTCRSRPPPPKR